MFLTVFQVASVKARSCNKSSRKILQLVKMTELNNGFD